MEFKATVVAVLLFAAIIVFSTIKQTATLYEKTACSELTEDELRAARFVLRASAVPRRLKLANRLGFVRGVQFRTFADDRELLRILKAVEGGRVRIYFADERSHVFDGRLMRASESGQIVLVSSDVYKPIGLWAEQVSFVCFFQKNAVG